VAGYLVNVTGPVSLVLDLHITHDRYGSSADPSINGHLHYPNDIDRSLNESVTDKIRKCRADYNNNPPVSISFMPAIPSTSGRLHSEFVCLLFLQAYRETDRFFATSGVQLAQVTSGHFHLHHSVFFSQFKEKTDLVLVKAEVLRITLNIDDTPITSRSHTLTHHTLKLLVF
jgi:hypothetical protein